MSKRAAPRRPPASRGRGSGCAERPCVQRGRARSRRTPSKPRGRPDAGGLRTDGRSAAAAEIAAGYASEGAALELGTVVVDGALDPAARVRIPLATMNRHGLVAGATGTGKTKTLQGIAEQLSAAGVPVVMADVKGDLSGLSAPGEANEKIVARAAETGDRRLGADRRSRSSSCRSAPRASVSRCAPPSPASGRSCSARCWGSTRPRSRRSG